MPETITGGCLCGAVRYTSAAQPIVSANCHCRDCQRASGGAYASAVILPRAAVAITGPVKYFEVKGESGNTVRRGFCPECGSRLFGMPDVAPQIMSVMAGSLDDPSGFRPAMNIYTQSAQPWVHLDPALPKFPRAPQR